MKTIIGFFKRPDVFLVLIVAGVVLITMWTGIRKDAKRLEGMRIVQRESAVLHSMREMGFARPEITSTKQFVETSTCYDFKVFAADSSGKAVWGHFLKCDPIDGSELVNYVVNDFCAEGAITCPPERQEYKCK